MNDGKTVPLRPVLKGGAIRFALPEVHGQQCSPLLRSLGVGENRP